jgi:hypothetical protein
MANVYGIFQAIQQNHTDDVILALLEADQSAAKTRNGNRLLLLHEVIAKKRSSSVILAILRANPDAAGYGLVVNRHCVTVIFQAIHQGCTDDVLLALLEANQSAAKITYVGGRLLLHEAIANNLSSSVILAILRANPDAPKYGLNVNSPVIYQAINQNYTDDVLLALLEADQSATKKTNGNGLLLLHEVIAKRHSSSVILAIFRANPDAAKYEVVVNGRAQVPLIFQAVNQGCTDDVILALLEANQSAAKKTNDKGRLLLHECILRNCSSTIIDAVLDATKEPPGWNVPRRSSEDSFTLPIIFSAIQQQCPDEILLAILEANMSASTVTDHIGGFLLDHVIKYNCSSDLVLAVLHANPDAAMCEVALNSHKVPVIFQAINQNYTDDVILALLEANESAAKKTNDKGRLLLHECILRNCSSTIINAVLRANQDAAKCEVLVNSHNVPLIYQAFNQGCTDDVLLALLEANQSAAKKTNGDGHLLLHYAIISNCSETFIMKIFQSYPWAAMIRCNNTGKLPLHFASENASSSKIVEALIRMYPEALDQATINNYYPRDYVTSALPTKSIEMICRPYSEWKRDILGKNSKEESVFDSIQQLNSNLVYLSKEFVNFSKCNNECGGNLESDQGGNGTCSDLKKKITYENSDIQQVLISVRQLTAEIAQLSRDFQGFLKSQIIKQQYDNAAQAYKYVTNDVPAERKKIVKREQFSVETTIGRTHELTADIASMSREPRISPIETSDTRDIRHEQVMCSVSSSTFGQPILTTCAFLKGSEGNSDTTLIEEAKIVQSVKSSDLSECFSLPTEFTESSRDNTNNFNSFVFVGKSIADGMKNDVISKGVLNLDKTPGTSSSKNQCQLEGETTDSLCPTDFSICEDNSLESSLINTVSEKNTICKSSKCENTTTGDEVKETELDQGRSKEPRIKSSLKQDHICNEGIGAKMESTLEKCVFLSEGIVVDCTASGSTECEAMDQLEAEEEICGKPSIAMMQWRALCSEIYALYLESIPQEILKDEVPKVLSFLLELDCFVANDTNVSLAYQKEEESKPMEEVHVEQVKNDVDQTAPKPFQCGPFATKPGSPLVFTVDASSGFAIRSVEPLSNATTSSHAVSYTGSKGFIFGSVSNDTPNASVNDAVPSLYQQPNSALKSSALGSSSSNIGSSCGNGSATLKSATVPFVFHPPVTVSSESGSTTVSDRIAPSVGGGNEGLNNTFGTCGASVTAAALISSFSIGVAPSMTTQKRRVRGIKKT